MGARSVIVSAVAATYLVIACATGGNEEPLEGGVVGDAPMGPDDSPSSDSPMGYDTSSPGDTGMMNPDSSGPFDSAPGDSFIPPTDASDATMPMETGFPDIVTPPMDVVVVTPKCPFNFKYALEVSIAESSDAGVPCTSGCTAGQCCAHFASPPICVKK